MGDREGGVICTHNSACKQTHNTNRVHKLGDAGRDVIVALAPVDGRAASLEGFPHDCDSAAISFGIIQAAWNSVRAVRGTDTSPSRCLQGIIARLALEQWNIPVRLA